MCVCVCVCVFVCVSVCVCVSECVCVCVLLVHEYFSAEIFLLKGFSCHSFAFTGTVLPAAAWPLPPRQSQQSVSTFML